MKNEALTPATSHQEVYEFRCRAKAWININTVEESLKAPTEIIFNSNKDRKEFKMFFLNPFGTRQAVLKMTSGEEHYFESSRGQIHIDRHPLFRQWFHDNWLAEISFLMGIVTSSNQDKVLVDSQKRPRLYQDNRRKWRCNYPRGKSSRHCRLEKSLELGEAQLNFSFLKCRRSPMLEAG